MSELVTIVTYHEPVQAQMTRAALEGSGIPCFLFGEHLAATRSLYGLSQGVEVRVRPEDVEAAVDLLLLNSAKSPPECPRCQSPKVEILSRSGGKFVQFALFLLCGLIPGFEARKKLRCNNCGHEWK